MAYEFRCVDVGASCPATIKAGSEDELVRKAAEHMQSKHKVQHVSRTLAGFVKKVAQQR